jgi:hypothetical protein
VDDVKKRINPWITEVHARLMPLNLDTEPATGTDTTEDHNEAHTPGTLPRPFQEAVRTTPIMPLLPEMRVSVDAAPIEYERTPWRRELTAKYEGSTGPTYYYADTGNICNLPHHAVWLDEDGRFYDGPPSAQRPPAAAVTGEETTSQGQRLDVFLRNEERIDNANSEMPTCPLCRSNTKVRHARVGGLDVVDSFFCEHCLKQWGGDFENVVVAYQKPVTADEVLNLCSHPQIKVINYNDDLAFCVSCERPFDIILPPLPYAEDKRSWWQKFWDRHERKTAYDHEHAVWGSE